MGIEADLPFIPSIALGSTEVSVLDMATVYATIANGGTAIEPTTIDSIRFPDGEEITPDQELIRGVLTPGNSYLLTKTLQRVILEGTGRSAYFGRPAAGKTGTSNDYADAWFVGYTPQLATAVWVGYPQGRIPMTSVHGGVVVGGSLPAYIWRSFMADAHEGLPVKTFEFPRLSRHRADRSEEQALDRSLVQDRHGSDVARSRAHGAVSQPRGRTQEEEKEEERRRQERTRPLRSR